MSAGTWPSVITARHLNDKSQPVPLPPTISRQLLEAGYTRLVVGHTPHGNCPTVVPGAVQTIMADTSYSNMKAADNRGDAVSVCAAAARCAAPFPVLPLALRRPDCGLALPDLPSGGGD